MNTIRKEADMSMQEMTCRILRILADNAVNTVSPRVMESAVIAAALGIDLARTRQLLNALHASGLVITNMESQYSLITEEGMRWLDNLMVSAGQKCG
ncbi:MAG: hypothetical protein F9K32_15510 [Desulfobulbaceae bacterium]|nr:MAG: hypothetical protein F9K32_15510 [Desulfobulbaceae bacterium]